MKRLLPIFLVIAIVFAAAVPALAALAPIPVLAASVPIPVDLFTHHLSIASIAIAAPSYAINEWCALRRYSRAEFYRMQFRGDGPDTIGKGRMRRVTPNADARWLKAQERKAKAEQTKAA